MSSRQGHQILSLSSNELRKENLAKLFGVSLMSQGRLSKAGCGAIRLSQSFSIQVYVIVTYLAPKILVASSASAGGVEMIISSGARNCEA